MSENIFLKKEIAPNDTLVEKKLGSNYKYLKEIRKFVKEIVDEPIEEWKYCRKKNGWLLKTLFKKRNLFFINICDDFFKITFVFGDKAINAVKDENISQVLIDKLLSTRKYAERRGLTIPVKSGKYLLDIQKLINIKINN